MIGYPDARDGADEEKFAVNLSDDQDKNIPSQSHINVLACDGADEERNHCQSL
jgi:hypothetical protein